LSPFSHVDNVSGPAKRVKCRGFEEIQSAGPPGPISRNDAVRLTTGDLVKHPEKENRK
jgi:hypothetical protein